MRVIPLPLAAPLLASGFSWKLQAPNDRPTGSTGAECTPVREGDARTALLKPFRGQFKLACGPRQETTVACVQDRCELP